MSDSDLNQEIKYPDNIHDWFSKGKDEEFSLWAFGCKQPDSNIKMIQCWEKLHPEIPMKNTDSIYICICKMNYIYQMKNKVKM